MIKRNKSKSNIVGNQKKEIKAGNFHTKNKLQHSEQQKQHMKHGYQIKYSQHEKKHIDVFVKHNFQKSKPLKVKGNHQKPPGKKIEAAQKRKSQSITSTYRPSSRLSNKRGSVLSTKSNKQIKHDNLNQNNKNLGNLQQVNHVQEEAKKNGLKKSTKNILSKNKLSLNENLQNIDSKIMKNRKNPSKEQKKNTQISQFEKKLSKFLNQKDLFSSDFTVNRKKSKKNIQKSQSRPSSRQNSGHKLFEEKKINQKKHSKQRQNLLQIYKFYKKTFDINLNNCVKKGATMTIVDKTRKTSSNCSLRPSYSSTLIQKFDKKNNEVIKLNNFQSKQMHSSNLSSTKDKKNSLFEKSGIETSKKQVIQVKKNNFLEKQSEPKSISKSRHSVGNSESSTKDNLVYANGSRQTVQIENSQGMTRNKRKKSFKQLIVYSSNNIDQPNQQNEQTNNFSANLTKESKEVIDIKNIEIGCSNIDVLKWCWNNTKQRQFKNQNQNKCNERQLQASKQQDEKLIDSETFKAQNVDNTKLSQKISEAKIERIIEQQMVNQKNVENKQAGSLQTNNVLPKKSQKMIEIEEQCQISSKEKSLQINPYLEADSKVNEFGKLRKKEEETSSIQQLSSIELMFDGKNAQDSNIPAKKFNGFHFQIQDSGFEL